LPALSALIAPVSRPNDNRSISSGRAPNASDKDRGDAADRSRAAAAALEGEVAAVLAEVCRAAGRVARKYRRAERSQRRGQRL